MREILFKAKDKETNEWIEGTPITAENGVTYIAKSVQFSVLLSGNAGPLCNTLAGDFYSVIPETVSQFTGLYDKNGKKIFEGDIIAYRKGCLAVSFDFASFGFLFEGYNGEEGYSHVIPFNDYENGIYIDRKTYQIDYEIVGNVFDNSDLLKGE